MQDQSRFDRVVSIGEPTAAVQHLLDEIHPDHSEEIRGMLIETLAAIGGDKVIERMILYLDDSDSHVAGEAMRKLIEVGKSSIEPLFEILKKNKRAGYVLGMLAGKSAKLMLDEFDWYTPLGEILEKHAGRPEYRKRIIKRSIKEIEINNSDDSDYLVRLLDLLVKLSPEQDNDMETIKPLLISIILGDSSSELKELAKKIIFMNRG